jgi:methionine-rich copper-binding protein CopC
MSSPESWSFTTASTHVPAVVELSPMANATNVSVNTSVTASFDEPVQPGSIVFVLRDSTNALVPTTFTYNSVTQTATWTPDAALASHMTYTATISAATDLLGNNMSDAVSWSFTTVDAQPATVVNQSPLANAVGVSTGTNITVTFSEPIQPGSITLILRDPSNQPVAGSLTYSEATRTATFVPGSPLASLASYSVTVSGVEDLAGNILANPLSWSFTTDGTAGTGPYKLFSDTAIPGTITDPDQNAVELGVRFRSDMSGYITGVRFYKGPNNTGTHIGNLWSSTGTLLASATFINETATGWQTVVFSSPVAISANTVYVASYFAPKGQYSIDEQGLLGGVNSGPLHVLPDGEDGPNGVYRYGSRSGFPTTGYMASNYWVDVLFSTVYVDNVAPTVITPSPTSNASNVALTASVTAKFSEAVQASTISCVVKDSSNNVVLASLTYDNSTKTVTLKPSSPLLAGTTYTVTVSGARDLAGNLMAAPFTWSFRTVNA